MVGLGSKIRLFQQSFVREDIKSAEIYSRRVEERCCRSGSTAMFHRQAVHKQRSMTVEFLRKRNSGEGTPF